MAAPLSAVPLTPLAPLPQVPDALKSSVPIGELAGVILLIVFGVRALREGLQADDPSASSTADEELADATEAVAAAEQVRGRGQRACARVCNALRMCVVPATRQASCCAKASGGSAMARPG